MKPKLAALILLLAFIGCSSKPRLDTDQYWAYASAKRYVEAAVPSVGLPKFAEPPEVEVTNIGGHVWRVSSWVEYSDKSARTIREPFVCTVEKAGEVSHNLVKLEMN